MTSGVLHVRKRRKSIRTLIVSVPIGTYLERVWSSENVISSSRAALKWIEEWIKNHTWKTAERRSCCTRYKGKTAGGAPAVWVTSSRAVHRKSRYFVHSVSTRVLEVRYSCYYVLLVPYTSNMCSCEAPAHTYTHTRTHSHTHTQLTLTHSLSVLVTCRRHS